MKLPWSSAALMALAACASQNAPPSPSNGASGGAGTSGAVSTSATTSTGVTGGGGGGPAGGTGGGGGSGETVPTFTDEERQILRTLAPGALPGPVKDVSNAYADDPRAIRLGERLFLDQAFSGQLLDADNTGGPNSLGARGQAGRVSCAGCHMPSTAFADTRSVFQEISLGTGWTHRRSPSLHDIGQAKIVMWGGRHTTLWSQPFGPFENPLEMNSSRLFVAQEIARRYKADYEAIFGAGTLTPLSDAQRFPALSAERTGCKLTQKVDQPRALPPDPIYECHGTPGDKAEYDGMKADDRTLVTRVVVNAGKALAAFERGLTCGPGRFDAWVAGDASALTASEQRGVKLFVGRAACVGCHAGPFFSDQKFHNVGLKDTVTKEGILNGDDHGAAVDLPQGKVDPLGILGPFSDGDDGRLPAAIGPEYEGAFRTPTLRCVSKRPSFMHTGTMHALEAVVAHFSKGGDPEGFHGTSVLKPLGLEGQDIEDVVAFLKALESTAKSAR